MAIREEDLPKSLQTKQERFIELGEEIMDEIFGAGFAASREKQNENKLLRLVKLNQLGYVRSITTDPRTGEIRINVRKERPIPGRLFRN